MSSSKEISIDTVVVWDFYKVMETRDHSIIGATEEQWMALYDEYFVAAELRMPDWKLMKKYDNALLKFISVRELLRILEVDGNNRESCKQALKNWKYTYNDNVSLENNLERFWKNLSVLETKLKMIEGELPKKNDQKLDVYKEVIQLKKHFKFDIDPKKTTCREWISLKKTYKEEIGSS